MFSFISKKISDKKFCTWDIICDKKVIKNLDQDFKNKLNNEGVVLPDF
jgi:hypothetical protein